MGYGSVSNEIKGRRGAEKGIEENRSLKRITEEGATFRSYHDGRIRMLTPELSIVTQRELGADIILTLDECTAYHVDKKYTEDSMERSHRWELRYGHTGVLVFSWFIIASFTVVRHPTH